MITPAQCRAARAWLNLRQDELARLISRNRSSIAKFESSSSGDHVLALAIQHVLEERGIRFLSTDYEVHRIGIEGPDDSQTEPPTSK
jgi:DNA-binding XRE family transcriptional regulator